MSEALHTELRCRFRASGLRPAAPLTCVAPARERYRQPLCAHPISTMKRRKYLPAELLSTFNAIYHLLPRQSTH